LKLLTEKKNISIYVRGFGDRVISHIRK